MEEKVYHVWDYNLARTKCGLSEKDLENIGEYQGDDKIKINCEECRKKL